jgi:hypothetical protein
MGVRQKRGKATRSCQQRQQEQKNAQVYEVEALLVLGFPQHFLWIECKDVLDRHILHCCRSTREHCVHLAHYRQATSREQN